MRLSQLSKRLTSWLRAGKSVVSAAILSAIVLPGQHAYAAASTPGGLPSKTIVTIKDKPIWQKPDGTFCALFSTGETSPPASANCPTGTTKQTPASVTFESPDPWGTILSGRLTLGFVPGDVSVMAGWFGEFGADPLLPAPPADGTLDWSSSSLIQSSANPAMASNSVVIDYTAGLITMYFDWGPNGFTPTLNLSPSGHFNFAGITMVRRDGLSSALTTIGGIADIAKNGTAASTYLQCSNSGGPYFCGEVPEPTTWAMLLIGMAAIGCSLRRRSRRKTSYRVSSSGAKTPQLCVHYT